MVVDEVVDSGNAAGGTASAEGSHSESATNEGSTNESQVNDGAEGETSGEVNAAEKEAAGAPKLDANGKPIVQAPTYKPNFKYKVYNEEKEFDETLKSLIKDKKSEDAIRDLVTKAQALDEMKPKYQKASEGYNTIQKEHQQSQQYWTQCNKYVREGDFDSLFELTQIPQQAILQWVHQKLKQSELPPEQQAMLNQNRQAKIRADQLETQNQGLNQTFNQQMVQMRTIELNTVLSRPEVSSAAQAFDKRMKELGRDTSFRKECVKRGYLVSTETGQDIPAEQAVQEVMALFGNVVPQAQSQTSTDEASGAQGSQPPPVIPNISGKGNSPARKVVKSLADLKKIGAEMA